MALPGVYARRFSDVEAAQKGRLWREVTRYLQRHVVPGAPVLDVACDRGDFIRNVRARERWASDLRDVSAHLPRDVRFVQADGLALGELLPRAYFGTVFMSNYLEHLRSSDDVVEQLRVSAQLLRPRGRIIVLQPNIRLVGAAYWDFIDHSVPLTEKSLVEAAEIAGFTTTHLTTRFLPYTTKSRLPAHPLLVRTYLRFPPAWLLLGKQTLYVGERPG